MSSTWWNNVKATIATRCWKCRRIALYTHEAEADGTREKVNVNWCGAPECVPPPYDEANMSDGMSDAAKRDHGNVLRTLGGNLGECHKCNWPATATVRPLRAALPTTDTHGNEYDEFTVGERIDYCRKHPPKFVTVKTRHGDVEMTPDEAKRFASRAMHEGPSAYDPLEAEWARQTLGYQDAPDLVPVIERVERKPASPTEKLREFVDSMMDPMGLRELEGMGLDRAVHSPRCTNDEVHVTADCIIKPRAWIPGNTLGEAMRREAEPPTVCVPCENHITAYAGCIDCNPTMAVHILTGARLADIEQVETQPWLASGVTMDESSVPIEGRSTDMDSGEGVKFDAGKLRYDLMPWAPLREVVRVFTYGAKKYDDWNWARGMSWGRCYAAMLRHLEAWRAGEDYDTKVFVYYEQDELDGPVERRVPGSGYHHLALAGCCLFMLFGMVIAGKGTDDRYSLPDSPDWHDWEQPDE